MLDPRLRGFVEAVDEDDAERRLGTLLETEAWPLIRRIAARKLHAHAGDAGTAQDLDDVAADALLALVSRLQALRADPHAVPIESFEDYTATVTFNAFAHYLRRRHPERSRLKNRLRYLLTRDPRLALWQTTEGLACGLEKWRPRSATAEANERLERLATEPERWLPWTRTGAGQGKDRAGLLAAVLQAAGGPVEFDGLVGALAAISPTPGAEPHEPAVLAALPDPAVEPADVMLDRRRLTEDLWRQIGELPVRQRVALLLNLRDPSGAGLLWVLPVTGVASMRQIARALEMPDLELAELWSRLPVPDQVIAERLGCNRQQVINLRAAARKRLAHGRGSHTPLVSASLKGEE